MSEIYTDEDVKAALNAFYNLETGERWPTISIIGMHDALDKVAPAIAARALREAAQRYPSDGGLVTCRSVREWLTARADEIANGRI